MVEIEVYDTTPIGGRPVPTSVDAIGRRHAPKRRIPTGLDWAAHRAPDAAPEDAVVTGPRTKREAAEGVVSGPSCWVCGTVTDSVDKSSMCRSCIDASDRLQELKTQRAAAVVQSWPLEFVGSVQQHLEFLRVTAHDVKVWALDQGLITEIKRGRISGALVDAYAKAHAGEERAS